MSFTVNLAAGTGAANGDTLDCTGGRLKLVFQVAGAALTGSDVITLQTQNLAGTWLPFATLTLAAPRVVVEGPGIYRAARLAPIATSSGCEYDAIPVS